MEVIRVHCIDARKCIITSATWGWLSNRGSWPRSRAFRALRGLLSCVNKQCFTTAAGWSSNQRNHPCRPVGSASQAGEAFPEGTSLCRPETSRVVRAALRVFASPACRASTGLGAISRACVRRAYECVDSGEPESGSASGRVQPVRECCRTACRGRGGPYNPSMKTFTSGG